MEYIVRERQAQSGSVTQALGQHNTRQEIRDDLKHKKWKMCKNVLDNNNKLPLK